MLYHCHTRGGEQVSLGVLPVVALLPSIIPSAAIYRILTCTLGSVLQWIQKPKPNLVIWIKWQSKLMAAILIPS